MKITKILPLIIFILFLNTQFFLTSSTQTQTQTHNIASFGARPDSQTDSSKAFLAAWNVACASPARSTIMVPQGKFMVRTAIKFSGSGCRSSGINFVIRGSILAPSDFRVLGSSSTWFEFESVDGVTISGGVFDGQGMGLWTCKRSGKGGCPPGVTVCAKLLSLPFFVFVFLSDHGSCWG